MEVGLECFDANGKKIFDSDAIPISVLGTGRAELPVGMSPTASGYIEDANIRNRLCWIKITDSNLHLIGRLTIYDYETFLRPVIWQEGNRICWKIIAPSYYRYDGGVMAYLYFDFEYGALER